jgi:aspartate aminotransferase
MPQISNKGEQMLASPIRKLVPYAEKAEQQGKTIYHLNIGQPDIHTPQEMLEAVKNIDLEVLAYSHSAGNHSYREKLTQYYDRFDIQVAPEQILVTTGASEALFFGLNTCLDHGDEIIIPEPFYANYNSFAQAAGVHIKPITASIEDDFSLPPTREFEKLITPKTKAILICNPNNPTGYLYTEEELQTLKELVQEHDLFLFADEVYREFCYEGRSHHSVMHLTDIEEHVILVDSISKRYSACGARIGALVSKNEEVIATALKFGQARLSPPTLAQIAAEAALEVPDSYMEEVQDRYAERREILVEALRNMEGVKCPAPGGAFYVMAELPVDDSEHFCQWMLESFDHENQTVMMAPAPGFYATEGLGKQEVRIAYVLNKSDLQKAMRCLEEGLRVYPHTTL